MKHPARLGLLIIAFCALALPAAADEIRLKDGKKLYGVIVGYDDNMFKVKTDFGFVLVEKDKIASIIPTTPAVPPAPKAEAKPAVKKEAAPESTKPAIEETKATADEKTIAATTASNKTENVKAVTAAPLAKPTVRPATKAAAAAPPPLMAKAEMPTAKPLAPPTAPPKPPEPPPNREEVQGNTYINYTHGLRMYKAPSWNVIDDTRQTLPNAIVALGTSNESTLMVIGQDKTKEPLETAAANTERRVRDAYKNYRRIGQKKTQVGGMPAVEYRYRGKAGEHDWSGTLVVVARGQEVFTVLGMTFADSDLIQIQENVIARAIASLSFTQP